MKELLDYLVSTKPGPISDTSELEGVLSGCWHEFDGSNAEGTAGYKLHNRMENVIWEPPILRFVIERHGATVQGSTRAALQHWQLNVQDQTANCSPYGHRQISPMQPRLDVLSMAEDIVSSIVRHQCDDRLKWNADGSVRIVVGKVLPEGSAVKQTLAGRRKRLRDQVHQLMAGLGWEQLRPNVYKPPDIAAR